MGNINDMTNGSTVRKIFSFALPLIMGYILQQMYLIIDAAIVGRWIGVNALAAVGASSSVMFLIMGFCNGACSGFAIPVAQRFGAKNMTVMRAFVSNSIVITAVMALVLTVVCSLLCAPILRMVNTPDDIFDDAYVFLLLQFLAIPFTMAYNLQASFIRALGNSRQPFFFLIASAVLNVILDVVFILLLRMNVEGAGVATLLSQAFACLLCLRYIRREMRILIPRGKEMAYDRHLTAVLLNNGVPMGMQFSITGIGIIMLQSANNSLGTFCVAAFTASMRVKYLFTCVFENIGVAMATYCGQNIGAHRVDRVGRGLRSALVISMVYFLITLFIVMPFADDMMRLFVQTGETQIVSNAALFMRVSCFFYPVLGVLTVLRYSIQGLGYGNLSMLSGVMEMIARCAVSIWLVPSIHFLGVCYADPMAWCAADLFLVPAMLVLYHRLRQRYGGSAAMVESCR